MAKIEIDLDVITAELDALYDTKARYEFELRKTKEEIEKNQLKLVALLGQLDVKEMTHDIYSFGIKETKRKAFDQKLFSSENPELFEKYKIEKVSEKFDFKINK